MLSLFRDREIGAKDGRQFRLAFLRKNIAYTTQGLHSFFHSINFTPSTIEFLELLSPQHLLDLYLNQDQLFGFKEIQRFRDALRGNLELYTLVSTYVKDKHLNFSCALMIGMLRDYVLLCHIPIAAIYDFYIDPKNTAFKEAVLERPDIIHYLAQGNRSVHMIWPGFPPMLPPDDLGDYMRGLHL